MAKHIIFLIHGMGEHPEGWSNTSQQIIKDVYQNDLYTKLADLPFDEFFEFKELTYDNIIETQRDQWRQDSTAVLEILQSGGATSSIIENATRLGGATNDDNFFNTHLLDVLLYRFIALLRDHIRVQVGDQIVTALQSIPDTEEAVWSFIAHSLGSIVIHDTLHLMFRGTSSPGVNHLERARYGPTVGLFAGNVSRLLQNDIDVYETSLVRPSLFKRDGILEFYLNARHSLDPFTKPKPFEPDADWLNAETRSKTHRRFQDIRPTEITEPNVHAFDHYLINPAVHVPFFRGLFKRETIITRTEENRSLERFRANIAQPFAALRRELLNLVENEGSGLSDMITAAKTFSDITSV